MRTFIAILIGAALALGIPPGLRLISRMQAPHSSHEWKPAPAPWGKVGMRGTDSRSTYTVHLTAGTPSGKDFSRPDESIAVEILQEGPAPGLWITYLATRTTDGTRQVLSNGSARLERVEQAIETIDGRMHFTTTYVAPHITLKVLDPSAGMGGRSKPSVYRAILTGRIASVFEDEATATPDATLVLRSFMPPTPWSYPRDSESP